VLLFGSHWRAASGDDLPGIVCQFTGLDQGQVGIAPQVSHSVLPMVLLRYANAHDLTPLDVTLTQRPGQDASPTEYWAARGSQDRIAASVSFTLMSSLRVAVSLC
jgi:hypothetical protein